MFCEVIELRKNGLRLRPEEWPAPVAGHLRMAQWDSSHTSYHSLDHWDMRTGRNAGDAASTAGTSLDHWDMRTGRNQTASCGDRVNSLDHWDMRTGRNAV